MNHPNEKEDKISLSILPGDVVWVITGKRKINQGVVEEIIVTYGRVEKDALRRRIAYKVALGNNRLKSYAPYCLFYSTEEAKAYMEKEAKSKAYVTSMLKAALNDCPHST